MSPTLPEEIRYFRSAPEFRTWLGRNHAKVSELWLGFYKKKSANKGITYPEALDEALCFGWIDGVRKSVDDDSFTIRFTPRKSKSIWSRINLKRVNQLIRQDRMAPPGVTAYEARREEKMDRYSYEQAGGSFDPVHEKQFRANRKAWSYFESQAPSYQRTMKWWVMSAKKEETRLKRLAQLIRDSANGTRVGVMPGAAAPAAQRKS